MTICLADIVTYLDRSTFLTRPLVRTCELGDLVGLGVPSLCLREGWHAVMLLPGIMLNLILKYLPGPTATLRSTLAPTSPHRHPLRIYMLTPPIGSLYEHPRAFHHPLTPSIRADVESSICTYASE